MDQPVPITPAEEDHLSEDDLRTMLEAREAEKEKQRKDLSSKANKLFLTIGGVLLILCVGLSYLIEWQREQHAAQVKKSPPAAKPLVGTDDANFARQLFEYVVPPPKPAPADK